MSSKDLPQFTCEWGYNGKSRGEDSIRASSVDGALNIYSSMVAGRLLGSPLNYAACKAVDDSMITLDSRDLPSFRCEWGNNGRSRDEAIVQATNIDGAVSAFSSLVAGRQLGFPLNYAACTSLDEEMDIETLNSKDLPKFSCEWGNRGKSKGEAFVQAANIGAAVDAFSGQVASGLLGFPLNYAACKPL
jgi:hypothetical protein